MSTKYYRDLLTQQTRIAAFRDALRRVVRPGDRVLEIGTGVGTFAFFAADAGAARVWAVDGDPIVHVARSVARRNRYGERIEWIRGWLPDVTLPEPVDVIVFEDFPPRLLNPRVFSMLGHLHARYTASGCRFVPSAARLWAAPVSSEQLHAEIAPFGPSEEAYGLRWDDVREHVANMPLQIAIPSAALAGVPVELAHVRFAVPPDTAGLRGRAEWTIGEASTIHGLAYWFDLELAEDITLSNGPGAAPGSWGHLFLPCDPPLSVAAGERLTAEVGPDVLAGGAPGWLSWTLGAGRVTRRGHEFASVPAALADLTAGSPDGIPHLTRRARIEAAVLQLTDGRRSVANIATGLRASYPEIGPDEALRLVGEILRNRAGAPLEEGEGP